MPNQPHIHVEQVSKKFARSIRAAMLHGIRDMANDFIGRPVPSHVLRRDEFWAVDRVEFEVNAGQCLGIVGPNGAGKTTLLQMLNGIFPPDRGRIRLRGRTGALIHLGAGCHPLLSGRENVYVNGAVLGLSRREINERMDAIIDFADLGDFIDSPVKIYSAGMFVRLGFAIAAQLRPQVLLIDEVLSVGDNHFRYKCFNHIRALLDRGCAIILVSHRMNDILTLCDSALLLSQGRAVLYDEPRTVVETYLHSSPRVTRHESDVAEKHTCALDCVQVLDASGCETRAILGLQPFSVRMRYRTEKAIPFPVIGIQLRDDTGRLAFASSTFRRRTSSPSLEGEGRVEVRFEHCGLGPGRYLITVTLSSDFGKRRDLVWSENAAQFEVIGADESTGFVQMDHCWTALPTAASR